MLVFFVPSTTGLGAKEEEEYVLQIEIVQNSAKVFVDHEAYVREMDLANIGKSSSLVLL